MYHHPNVAFGKKKLLELLKFFTLRTKIMEKRRKRTNHKTTKKIVFSQRNELIIRFTTIHLQKSFPAPIINPN